MKVVVPLSSSTMKRSSDTVMTLKISKSRSGNQSGSRKLSFISITTTFPYILCDTESYVLVRSYYVNVRRLESTTKVLVVI